ncbi:MAG TPA: hypothetical protein DER01_05905, partial [Phycisphaerales bacterium]|nr:hypothetical protein [Phycisphaerales bacterium]
MKQQIANWLGLLVLIVTVTPLWAQDSPLLDNHRWQEYSYGVSILPPLGANVHKRSVDDAVARITTKDGYAINLFIKESQNQMNIDAARKDALTQMAGAFPSAIVLDDQINKIGKHQALKLHFYLPRTKQGPWVTAQTFVQLSPTAFALFQLETPKKTYELARPVYEAVIQSMQVSDPRKLLADREKLLDAGHQLLETLKFDQLKKQLVPEQWFRFVQGDRDIGYMRIRQAHGKLDGRPIHDNSVMERLGFKVEVMARIEFGKSLYDSVNTCYVSDEHDEEIWSIRTNERPIGARKINQLHLRSESRLKFDVQEIPVDFKNAWVETGLLSNRKIRLSRHDPSSDKEFEWDMPPKGYLSQVDLYLLPMLLADQPDGMWGFYAYHPNSGRISFRTERVEHKNN